MLFVTSTGSVSPLQAAVYAHPRVRVANKPWRLDADALEDTSSHLTYEACMTGHRGEADDWGPEEAAHFPARLAAAQVAAGLPPLDWEGIQCRVFSALKNTLIAATAQYDMAKEVSVSTGLAHGDAVGVPTNSLMIVSSSRSSPSP